MIVITTPTGLIGQQVLTHLLNSDEPIRVIVRNSSRLPDDVRERVEVIQGSHSDFEVVSRAFAGADSVLWIVPADPHAESAEVAYVGFIRPRPGPCVRKGSNGWLASRLLAVDRPLPGMQAI